MKGVHPALVAELRESRIAADKMRIECVTLHHRIEELEEECEAQREFISHMALMSGGSNGK